MKRKKEISAGGIIYKQKNNKVMWLITQHSTHKGWIFPKGLVGDKNPNESKETAALREVKEEGGIKAKIIYPTPIEVNYSYQWKGSPHAKSNSDIEDFLITKKVYYFLMEYLSGNPKNHDWEVSEAKFVSYEEVKRKLTFKTDQKAFKKAINLFNSLKKTEIEENYD